MIKRSWHARRQSDAKRSRRAEWRHQINRQLCVVARSNPGPVSIRSSCFETVGRTTKERLSAGGNIATKKTPGLGGEVPQLAPAEAVETPAAADQ